MNFRGWRVHKRGIGTENRSLLARRSPLASTHMQSQARGPQIQPPAQYHQTEHAREPPTERKLSIPDARYGSSSTAERRYSATIPCQPGYWLAGIMTPVSVYPMPASLHVNVCDMTQGVLVRNTIRVSEPGHQTSSSPTVGPFPTLAPDSTTQLTYEYIGDESRTESPLIVLTREEKSKEGQKPSCVVPPS
ncbi:hypothetical protein BU15DRAFT_67388 [Melanogaster broomeanus]|nr:hypothetical protein BU15DRAFT_67388 [Melanogaster broomeanus]